MIETQLAKAGVRLPQLFNPALKLHARRTSGAHKDNIVMYSFRVPSYATTAQDDSEDRIKGLSTMRRSVCVPWRAACECTTARDLREFYLHNAVRSHSPITCGKGCYHRLLVGPIPKSSLPRGWSGRTNSLLAGRIGLLR